MLTCGISPHMLVCTLPGDDVFPLLFTCPPSFSTSGFHPWAATTSPLSSPKLSSLTPPSNATQPTIGTHPARVLRVEGSDYGCMCVACGEGKEGGEEERDD